LVLPRRLLLPRFLLLALLLPPALAAPIPAAVLALVLDLREERSILVGALGIDDLLGGRRAHAAAGDLVGVLGCEGFLGRQVDDARVAARRDRLQGVEIDDRRLGGGGRDRGRVGDRGRGRVGDRGCVRDRLGGNVGNRVEGFGGESFLGR